MCCGILESQEGEFGWFTKRPSSERMICEHMDSDAKVLQSRAGASSLGAAWLQSLYGLTDHHPSIDEEMVEAPLSSLPSRKSTAVERVGQNPAGSTYGFGFFSDLVEAQAMQQFDMRGEGI